MHRILTPSRRVAAAAGVAAVAMAFAVAAPGHAHASIVPSELAGLIADANPSTIADAAKVATDNAGSTAIDAALKGTRIVVPTDPIKGIVMNPAAGPTITIGLPSAATAGDARVVAPGAVSFDNHDGSSTVPVVRNDGSVAVNTVISGSAAPTSFSYALGVPTGSRLELTRDGGARIVARNGSQVASIAPAWAKDANGRSVSTRYEVAGNTLRQVVEHRAGGVAYPVVADPWVKRWYGWDVQFNRNQTNNIMFGLAGATAASLFIPDPTVTKVVAAALAGLTGYANWAYNRGGCLKLRITYTMHVIPGHYYRGNCR